MGDLRLTARPVARSVEDLLAGASWRGPMDKHVDSLSGPPHDTRRRAALAGRGLKRRCSGAGARAG